MGVKSFSYFVPLQLIRTMPPVVKEIAHPPNNKRRGENLTYDQRLGCLSMLLGLAHDGKIIYGGLRRVESLTGVPCAVLKRLWKKSAEGARPWSSDNS